MKCYAKYVLIVAALLLCLSVFAFASNLELSSKSACLMEATTGKVLYEINADEKLEPASVTKIMSLILVFEAIDEGKFTYDTPVCASEHASSMGGSQIWLEPGENMTVSDMLKAVVVASANDCTVALGELVSGSEEGFVDKMNEKAKLLGMNNTHFVNCTGLPAENHYTTARDIAIMTRELHKHSKIYDYTRIWTDTLRNGEFGISNTNKLIRFYSGATGMKTGYTSSALYCMSATACKNNMNLIASVMKCETSDKRFADAKKLLDYGFANYAVYTPEKVELNNLDVNGGEKNSVALSVLQNNILIKKGDSSKIKREIKLQENVKAPVKKGTELGKLVYTVDGEEIATFPITAKEDVEKITWFKLFGRILAKSIAVR